MNTNNECNPPLLGSFAGIILEKPENQTGNKNTWKTKTNQRKNNRTTVWVDFVWVFFWLPSSKQIKMIWWKELDKKSKPWQNSGPLHKWYMICIHIDYRIMHIVYNMYICIHIIYRILYIYICICTYKSSDSSSTFPKKLPQFQKAVQLVWSSWVSENAA